MELPCIWMSAGLVRYKLCTRGFDCEHCPLDAGLRGDGGRFDSPASAHEIVFPGDRRYAPGHCWVLMEGGDRARLGIDSLAVALAGPLQSVRALAAPGPLAKGSPLCRLEIAGGAVPLSAPVAGRSLAHNRDLERAPHLVTADPYGEGWMAAVEGVSGLSQLLGAEEARERARLDVRHLRRKAAMRMLRDVEGLGPTLPDGGEPITDLRGMLGAAQYLSLVREIVR